MSRSQCIHCNKEIVGGKVIRFLAGFICEECSIDNISILFPTIINIRSQDGEYRVPGPARTEAQAYYTDDRNDAIGTAIAEYKRAKIYNIVIKVNGRPLKEIKSWQNRTC